MERRDLLPAVVALAGLVAIAVGVHQELLHLRSTSPAAAVHVGWDGPVGGTERELVVFGALGALGALWTVRWRTAAAVPLSVGGWVIFEVIGEVGRYVPDLFTGLSVLGGTTGSTVLGAEPYLLGLGGLLLVIAGALELPLDWDGTRDATDDPAAAT